ncbi:MAG: hypothetical protein ACKO2V_03905, partial [Snowella sp.]
MILDSLEINQRSRSKTRNFMTSLLVQSPSVPLTIHFPLTSMTVQEFYEFCLANRDLRIERNANGEV